MQDFIDQAKKNNVILNQEGPCQFCGAKYTKGIYECMEKYNTGLEILEFSNSKYLLSRFLSVDAHALQHPEIHGRWSNHFHLTRLNLILHKNQNWDYSKSPILSDFLNGYKLIHPDEYLIVPKALERGLLTMNDTRNLTSPQECVALIKKWAMEVYNAWSINHSIVSHCADQFLKEYKHV